MLSQNENSRLRLQRSNFLNMILTANLFLFLVLPLATVFTEAFRKGAGAYWDALREPDALAAAAKTRAGLCLMHMQGEPRSMQAAPHYDDVVGEVTAFLAQRLAACRDAGIEVARLTVDPGFGFGKRIEDNLALLKHLGRFRELGVPLAVGLSRKSMLATLTGRGVDDRTAGSVALAAIAVLNGARIVRAHDVAATIDAIRVAAATAQGEEFDGT